jgi:D-sedoheptulose 7-phosphate isomerase
MMNMKSIFNEILTEHVALVESVRGLNDNVVEVAKLAACCLRNEKKILILGNGGSASDSQHFAAELVGRFVNDRKPLAAISLSTDTSILTSVSNDYSFDETFTRQIKALGQQGDMLFAISTSGNSMNAIKAVKEANNLGINTVGLLGKNGGELQNLCNYSITIPSNVTARIQEYHIIVIHTLCMLIEAELGLS